ncbi:soyasaponin III rhamnosyltransferase-like [Pyrus x bretschneideri]|uniref:soyasaponin III rhamnosyltransferase-like n=1 Tax=Pyrus x bretschneideri TaxID=225117 RepID=UPI0020303897|nr:soyasaponin III rhamnosyltransferase-like [Pyrus x bretschneideri]
MEKDDHLSVVMLPWSAFGHMMPFFQLSIALAKAKVHVSFISTPKNIKRLPKILPDLQPFVQLVPIPFPPLDPDLLPEGAEATVDLRFENTDNLKIAYDLLQKPIKQFIADRLPDWIITDFAAHWVVEIGREYGVPLVYFSVFSAATRLVFRLSGNLSSGNTNDVLPSLESLTLPPDLVTFQSTVAFREHEAVRMHAGFYGGNESGISDAERNAKILSACQVLAVRSCDEFEGEYLEAYKNNSGKFVIPTGLLPPEIPAKGVKGEISTDDGIYEWLDKQKTRSVVFVGFGSECKLSKEQVFGIAHGLELSELPFIWALRKPNWANSEADALPLGFVDRTSEKGLVCFGWVPQMEILAHPSVGGSLLHSGWGSIIETLQFGHVLVVRPFIIDQPLNARLLEEKGMAVEVKRRGDGSFSRDDIAKRLRHAMVEEGGEQLRSNARKAGTVFGNHKLHQDHYIGQFVNFLKNNTTERSSCF